MRLQVGRDERADKKRATEQRAAEIDAVFEECLGMRDADGYCTCRVTWLSLSAAPCAKSIKKGKCRVGTCMQAASGAPLLCTGLAPVLAINE